MLDHLSKYSLYKLVFKYESIQNICKAITRALLCLNYEEHKVEDIIILSIKKLREEFQEQAEKQHNYQATVTSQKLMGEL